MNLKKLFFAITIFINLQINAQDYLIRFSGTGASTSVSSVKVENLTAGTYLILKRNEILHLTGMTGISNIMDMKVNEISLYPNPVTNDNAFLLVYPPETGNGLITVSDITGKILSQIETYLGNYPQKYLLTGLKNGIYFITVKGNSYSLSGKLMSSNNAAGTVKIEKQSSYYYPYFEKYKKNESGIRGNVVDMAYTSGDRLKFTGTSGIYSTIKVDTPEEDKSICFNFVECTDKDNNNYPIVEIGSQIWMAENLKSTKFNDGTTIANYGSNINDWSNNTSGAYSWYNNDNSRNKNEYGALYNWYAINSGNLCPTGWHVPKDEEWIILINSLGGAMVAGGKIKETGNAHWPAPNNHSNNESGFSMVPAGILTPSYFTDISFYGYLWSSSFHSNWKGAPGWYLSSSSEVFNKKASHGFNEGLSVRCLLGKTLITAPFVETNEIFNITANAASGGGTVTSDGGAPVTGQGVCWGVSENPTVENNKSSDDLGAGSFISKIAGLQPGTKYYVRAYATNSAGTGYGSTLAFKTMAVIPSLSTKEVSEIKQTHAISGGTFFSTGGATVTVSGICWSTTQNPSVNAFHTTDGKAEGSFISTLTGLIPNTLYYVKVYATNSAGTGYGNEVSFKTDPIGIASVISHPVTNLTSTSAVTGGDITNDGGADIIARGTCWAANPNPTTADESTVDGTGSGSFISNISGLLPGITYHARTYATNSVGTAYSEDFTFTTETVVPTVSTTQVSGVKRTYATSGGNISANGGAAIIARGVCWSTSANPLITGFHTTDGTGNGIFISNLTGLLPNTLYYVRAYATNSTGTAYGNEVSFTTGPVHIATLTSLLVSSITSTSAVSGGNITNDGDGFISARGICWAISPNPTTANESTSDGTGTGTFSSNITGLLPGTNYHIRAYATNSAGTAYGNDLTFTTLIVIPSLTTNDVTDITKTTSTSGGNITSDGGAAITSKGVCWSTSRNPSLTASHTTDGSGSSPFISNLAGLSPNTLYYIRAYATNSIGTAYGNEISFTSAPVQQASLNSVPVTSITTSTAISGGNIIDDGGGTITSRGICWATTINPTIANESTSDGTGSGNFTSSISGLLPATTYHIRAYATNIAGTAYGNEFTFTTLIDIPTLTTSVASAITRTTASSGGNITSNGGAAISVRGICWSTSRNPAVSDEHTTDGTGNGGFVSSLTGLLPNTMYYIRAYATNSAGTAYGNEVSFSTSPVLVATVSTTAVSSVTGTTAVSGGNISDDGGGIITGRGVCWGTNPAPTIGNGRTNDGTGTGSFTSTVSGLQPGTSYHVRAYATNSAGTAYGEDLTFTTSAVIPTISTSSVSGITRTLASSGGNITSNGGATVTSRGVCWGTISNPTVAGSHTNNGTGNGSFVSNITGLVPSTLYYVRAYAVNSVGTSYGNQVSFTTSPLQTATLTTASVSNIASTTAVSGGNITDDGGDPVTSRGVCWATTTTPTVTNDRTTDTGDGSFVSNITGLLPLTTYYIRAYATNSIGTAYGNEINFLTGPVTNPDINFYQSTDGSILLHSLDNKKIILVKIGVDRYIQYSNDNGVTYNQGVKVTSFFTSYDKARILSNGVILLFSRNKFYYSNNNLSSINPCNVLNKNGSAFTFHTPVNASYPGGYFDFMGGFVEKDGVYVLGNYANSSAGASPVNLYYSLDGIRWKVFYTFGQNPSFTDNGTAMGGTGGTLLGDVSNPLIARHIHAINIGGDGNFYVCTGDGNQELHFLKCTYNKITDTWNTGDLLTGNSRNWQRMRGLGVFERNGYLYWGSDGPGTFTYNGVQYNCFGIYKCAVADINDPSRHILLQNVPDACYSFINTGNMVFAGFQSYRYIAISFDYGETWTFFALPGWMSAGVEGVWYNTLNKHFGTDNGVQIESGLF